MCEYKLTGRDVAGVIAVGGRVEIVLVSVTSGVDERLTQPRLVVEEPTLYRVAAVTGLNGQKTFRQQLTAGTCNNDNIYVYCLCACIAAQRSTAS